MRINPSPCRRLVYFLGRIATGPVAARHTRAGNLFADGDAAFLGVDQVTVPNGDAVFPVLTNRPTVGGPHSDSTEVEETTGAFTAELVKPARLQAAFTYRRVDVARFSAMGESLRQALNEALSESLDVQIVSGANGHKRRSTRSRRTSASLDSPASMAGTRRPRKPSRS